MMDPWFSPCDNHILSLFFLTPHFEKPSITHCSCLSASPFFRFQMTTPDSTQTLGSYLIYQTCSVNVPKSPLDPLRSIFESDDDPNEEDITEFDSSQIIISPAYPPVLDKYHYGPATVPTPLPPTPARKVSLPGRHFQAWLCSHRDPISQYRLSPKSPWHQTNYAHCSYVGWSPPHITEGWHRGGRRDDRKVDKDIWDQWKEGPVCVWKAWVSIWHRWSWLQRCEVTLAVEDEAGPPLFHDFREEDFQSGSCSNPLRHRICGQNDHHTHFNRYHPHLLLFCFVVTASYTQIGRLPSSRPIPLSFLYHMVPISTTPSHSFTIPASFSCTASMVTGWLGTVKIPVKRINDTHLDTLDTYI